MTDLRQTETNSADDTSGRAFGLDGNLYLPVLLALLAALVIFAGLGVVLHVSYSVAGGIAAGPLLVVSGWVLLLKQGRPAGYDRDLVEYLFGGGDFTRVSPDQGGLVE